MAAITIVKGQTSALDRTWMGMPDGSARQVAVHVVHDLPHLVVESMFGLDDGLWGELAAGSHAEAGRAAAARDPQRPKQGPILSGAAAGVPADQWLTPGHRVAKSVTNCVTNRWEDGADTPGGVRERAARQDNPALTDLLARVDDETIMLAIRGVRDLEQRWMAVPPGGKLTLSWPLR